MKTRYYLFLLPLLALNCKNAKSENVDELLTANRKLGEVYFEEVWNKGNVSLLDSLLSPKYINHAPSAPTISGPEGLKPIVKAIRKAFPDLHFEIKEIIPTSAFVTIRTIMTGTQKDTLFGIPPSGKPIKVMQINIEKIEKGRIAEHWRVTDELTMMKQLGVVK
jgi:steroid delta-isomerase-like uncharacterized protein